MEGFKKSKNFHLTTPIPHRSLLSHDFSWLECSKVEMEENRKVSEKPKRKLWRVVGFDDCFRGDKAYIVGCVTCGDYIEGFLIDRIDVDGWDVSDKIVDLISNSKFFKQIRCILLSGITFAGFNVANLEYIYDSLDLPVVVVLDKKPNFEKIESALRNLEGFERRYEFIKKAGEIKKVDDVFVQVKGCDYKFAQTVLRLTVRKGKIPEPLRIAHLVASALIHRESKRR